MTKRCYFVKDDFGEYGLSIVAEDSKDAKRRAYSHDLFTDGDYVDLRVKRLWDVKTKDLEEFELGYIFEGLDGLKIGAYSWYEDTCPICKEDNGRIQEECDIIGCWDCISKELSENE